MEEILTLFKEDILSANLDYMVDAANKLTIVAVALGPEATLSHLLPFLDSVIPTSPDEVLVAIARQFWNIFDIAKVYELAASSDSMKTAFACLRALGQDEEIVVRDCTIESFLAILPTLGQEQIDAHVFPLFKTFALHTEFGPRYTAGSILPQIYRCAPATMRDELLQILLALSQDESPIVRTRIASVLPELCAVLTKLAVASSSYPQHVQTYDIITNTVLPILLQLSLDERDYLRDVVPAVITKLVPFVPLKDYQAFFVPLITAMADDLSWSVRKSLCQHLPLLLANLITRALYQYKTEADLAYPDSPEELQAFKAAMTTAGGACDLNKYVGGVFNLYQLFLLHDNNVEVRGAGVLIMNDMFHMAHGIIPADFFDKFPRDPVFTALATELDSLNLDLQSPSLTPAQLATPYTRPAGIEIFTTQQSVAINVIGAGLYDLVQDLSSLTKVDLCEMLSRVSPLLGFEFINRYVIPVINILAHDENVQVRSSVITSLSPILLSCPPQVVVDQIWPVIEGLGADLRWRVRRSVTTQISALCYHLRANEDFIIQSVIPLVEGLFSENVHAVRNRMAVEFSALVHILGPALIKTHFLNWCRDLFNPKANYLHRITALHFMYYCSTAHEKSCSKEFVYENFNKYFLDALQDQVPNVKILACRYIIMILQRGRDSPWDEQYVKEMLLDHFKAMAADPNNDREVTYQGKHALEVIAGLY